MENKTGGIAGQNSGREHQWVFVASGEAVRIDRAKQTGADAELPTNTLQNDGSLSRVLVQFRGRTSQSVGSEQLRGYASRLRQRLSDVLRACSGAVFLADVDERASLHGDRTVVG